ncbi:hypothetical protein EVG20_g7352 [Dentipellis fragilis]|uniref:Uncharacterized protein n=1 Tax=Dentipellis fragilis TaxID=205917 RepID=A0A4Y9YI54_9AGAM|nr:hypothetical protein EVG20_g7352 [Dentipellis fragilis]
MVSISFGSSVALDSASSHFATFSLESRMSLVACPFPDPPGLDLHRLQFQIEHWDVPKWRREYICIVTAGFWETCHDSSAVVNPMPRMTAFSSLSELHLVPTHTLLSSEKHSLADI